MPETVDGPPLPSPVSRLARGFAALGLGSLLVTACEYDDYPVEASFCDDWRRTACAQEPENCVRDCERARPRAACLEYQVRLRASEATCR